MSVSTIFKVVLHPFIQESLASLNTMTEYSGTAGELFVEDVENFRFKGYAVCCSMKGSINGVILLHHYEETAVAIGNSVCESMLGANFDYEQINEELAMALSEWSNTLVGRATDKLNRHNLGFEFSSPEFVLSLEDMDKYLENVKQIVTVPIHVDGVGRYYFNLLVQDVNYQSQTTETKLQEPNQQLVNTSYNQLPQHSQILLVDDSPLVLKAMEKFLSDLGYNNVVTASDGSEAIEIVESQPVDFIFMDVVMKRVNGDEALARIRRDHPSLPIVMLSSVTDAKLVANCEQIGISGFIFKPLHNKDAHEKLQEYLKIA